SFPITVTSTGGGVTKTTAFTLSVTVSVSLVVATPTITPNGGSFSGSMSVTMQSATSGSSIYYTTNGSTPTQSSILYTVATTLTSSATVNAKAFMSGYNPSAVASASFTNTSTNTVTGNTYYVAQTGSNSNACAQAQNSTTPKATIIGASGGISCLAAGDALDIRSGTYNESITSYGTPTLPVGTSSSPI